MRRGINVNNGGAAATKQLGTNGRSALRAARLGYLVVARRSAFGRITSFEAASVGRLIADYIFTGQLAHRLNVWPIVVYSRMRAAGIKPVIPAHTRTEGLWSRTDLEQLGDVLPFL